MLKWITYDGTTETLPPHVSEVLLMRDPIYGLKLCLASTFNEYAVKGWSWLPIPTPADCDKWEALRRATQELSDMATIMCDGIMENSTDPKAVGAAECIWESLKATDKALAALDAPQEQG